MKRTLLLLCLTAIWAGCSTDSSPFTPSDIGGGNPMSGSKTGSTATGTSGTSGTAGTTGVSGSSGGTGGQSCPTDHTHQGQLGGGTNSVDVSQLQGNDIYDPKYVGGLEAQGQSCASADDCGPSSCNCGAPTAFTFAAAACVGGLCADPMTTCNQAVSLEPCLCE